MKAITIGGGVRGVGIKKDGSAMVVTLQGRGAAAVVALSGPVQAPDAAATAREPGETEHDARVLCWLGAAPDAPVSHQHQSPLHARDSVVSSLFRRPDLVAVDDSDEILVCDPAQGKVLAFTFEGCLRGSLHAPTAASAAAAHVPQHPGDRAEWRVCGVAVDPVSGLPLLAQALWCQGTPPSSVPS